MIFTNIWYVQILRTIYLWTCCEIISLFWCWYCTVILIPYAELRISRCWYSSWGRPKIECGFWDLYYSLSRRGICKNHLSKPVLMPKGCKEKRKLSTLQTSNSWCQGWGNKLFQIDLKKNLIARNNLNCVLWLSVHLRHSLLSHHLRTRLQFLLHSKGTAISSS